MAYQQLYRMKSFWWIFSIHGGAWWVIFGVYFHFGVNGVWVSRHGVPLCSSWVFIRALWMTTEYIAWLGMGIRGKVMEFWTPWRNTGCPLLARSQPRRRRRNPAAGCDCVSVCVVVGLQDVLRELTQNNDRFTAPGRRAHVAKIKQKLGSLWALEQIWHNWIVQ